MNKTIWYIFIVVVIWFSAGCNGERRMTQTEWLEVMPWPETKVEIIEKIITKTDWLVTIYSLGFVAGLFLTFAGNLKFGLPAAAACFCGIWLRITLAAHAILLAWIGAGIVVLITAVFIWQEYEKHRALKEIITNVEDIKKIELNNSPAVITHKTVSILSNQSTATKKIVKKIRNKIKEK